MKKAICFLWQWLWGAPQSLLGLMVFLRWRKQPHFWYHGALVTVWNTRGGMSLGMFVFIPAAAYQRECPDAPPPGSRERCLHTLHHEYGHTLQSLLLGPLYLPVIGLPSWLWCNLPPLRRLRQERAIPYDAAYMECWATGWGERMAGHTKD